METNPIKLNALVSLAATAPDSPVCISEEKSQAKHLFHVLIADPQF